MDSSSAGAANQAPTVRTLCLPEGFDLRGAPTRIWQSQREIKVFVSRILTARVAVGNDRKGFTPVRWENGVAAFGSRRWKPARDWLEATGFIECDHDCRVGSKAYWYRLGEQWRPRPVRQHQVNDSVSLAAWLAIRGQNSGVPPEESDPVRDHLNRWLRSFTFDPEAIARGMASIDGKNAKKRKGQTTEDAIAEERRAYAEMIVELSKDPDERDGEYCPYGRFHSLITRMPRWMREAIRIDDAPLGEVDIRATQPLVQAILATPTGGTAPATPGGHTIYLPNCTYSLPDDLAEFFRDYPTVDFYRWVAPKFGMPCDTDSERDAVKKAWAWLVFDRPRWNIPEWRDRWEAYRAACPSVAAWLEDAKRDNYREAARTCQRFESRLMIQEVCGWLRENHPDLPILTIHDAILAPPDRLPIVCEAIRTTWGKLGVEPAMKIKASA